MTHEQKNRNPYLEGLIEDLQRAAIGRAMVDVDQAALITGMAPSLIKKAIERGELICSRNTRNGKRRLSCRRLGEWIVSLERHSAPEPR